MLHSKIGRGWVRHRRFQPRNNSFKYQVFMMYLDLDEIDQVLELSTLWGRGRLSIARFLRKDFWGDGELPLKDAVLNTAQESLGFRPQGPVRMLTNLRYFGYITNPLTTYYCFDSDGETLRAIIANVNNTPWGEHHAYVLPVNGRSKFRCEFNKTFHVSPFNPMDMHYRWLSNAPDNRLWLHLENWMTGNKVMDATLNLSLDPITSRGLNAVLIQYPVMTVKVITLIYWQALKLWWKKVPYVPHNSTSEQLN